MKSTSTPLRLLLLLFVLLAAPRAWGQFVSTAPTIDATADGVTSYPNSAVAGSGSTTTYRMSWTDTDLYIHIQNAQENEPVSIFLDVDPISPVNGGTDANGSLVGINYDGYTTPPNLPFRADVLIYAHSGYREIFRRNGSGGWTSLGGTPNGIRGDGTSDYTSGNANGHYASNQNGNGLGADDRREMRISWSRLQGTINSGARPTAFNWLGYISYNNGMYGELPVENYDGGSVVANTSGTNGLVRYYTVPTTVSGGNSPFLNNSYTHPPGNVNGSFGGISVFDFTINSATGSITRTTGAGGAWTIGRNLVVGAGTLSYGTSSNSVTAVNVLQSGGTHSLSTVAGGDLNVSGNFTKTAGTFTPNGRQLNFNGTIKQTFSSSTAEGGNMFLLVSNTTDSVRIASNLNSTTAGNTVTFNAGSRVALVGGATLTHSAGSGAFVNNGSFQILPGATFVHGGTGAFTLGASSLMNVFGTFRRTGASTLTTSSTTLVIGATGTYDHALNSAAVPTASWSAGSTCLITGTTATAPGGMGQNFHHVVWNCPGQTSTAQLSLTGTLNWGGNLQILNTFTSTNGVRLTAGTATFNIGGNLEVSAATGVTSIFDLGSGASGTLNLNISGNLIHNATGTGVARISNAGGGTTNNLNFVRSTGTQTITQTGGTMGTQNGINWVFGNGSTTNTVQLLTSLAKGSGTGTVAVGSGSTLDFGTSEITGGGAFTAAAGATLRSANTNGSGAFSTSGATGSVQTTGTRTYTAGTNYTFNGAAAQFTGNGVASTTAGTITINNSAGVTLTNATSTGTLAFTAGSLPLGANNLTVNTAITGATAARYVQTNGAGTLTMSVPNTNTAVLFPVGNSAYNPVTFTQTASGTTDNFSVRVVDGAPIYTPSDATLAINRMWVVTEGTAGGNGGLTVATQANSADPVGANYSAGSGNVIGLTSNGPGTWTTEVAATNSGGNPFTYTAALAPAATTYALGMGRPNAFAAAVPAPTITGFSPATGYTGTTITIDGTNLTSLSAVTIGGVAANIITQTGTQATVTVGAGASGTISVTNNGGTATSGSSFTYLGYITTAAGVYTTAGTWLGNAVPPAGQPVTIAHAVTLASAANAPTAVTILGGASLAVNAGGSIAPTGTVLNDGTLTSAGTGAITLAGGSSLTNNGTATLAGTTTFSTGTVTLDGTTGVTFSGPWNVNGTASLTTSPTVSANLTLGAGAAPMTGAATVTYTITGNLVYATGANITGPGQEWTATGTTAGAGVPQNITIQGAGTYLNHTSGSRGNAGNLTIGTGSSLDHSAGTIAVNGNVTLNNTLALSGTANFTVGPNGGGNRVFTMGSGGVLRLLTGAPALTVNGNVVFSTGVVEWTMNNGTFTIDPNDGTSGGSVAAGTHTFDLTTAPTTFNVNGGSIVIVDPPFSGAGLSLRYNMTGTRTMLGNTITFGGSSGTNSSTATNGFNVDTYVGGGNLRLGNVVINGGSGASRFVSGSTASANSLDIQGDVVINPNSELRTLSGGGRMTLGGNLVNDGTLTLATDLWLGLRTGLTLNPATTAQTISGGGTFRNATTSPTANFSGITVNNTATPVAVTFNIGDITLGSASTLTLTNGVIDVGAANNLTLLNGGTGAIATPSATAYILRGGSGALIRTLNTTGTYVYPVGEATGTQSYSPLSLNFTTLAAAGTLGVRVADGDPANLNTPSTASDYLSRSWLLSNATLGTYTFNAAATYITGVEDEVGTVANALPSRWTGAFWQNYTGSTNPAAGTFITSGISNVNTSALNGSILTARLGAAVSYTWNGNVSAAWNEPGNWTPAGVPAANDNVTLADGAPNNLNLTTSQTVTGLSFIGTGNFFSVAAGTTLVATGAVNYVSGTGTWDATSTFSISSSSAQTVPAFNYGNLTLTGGARTFSSGATYGIAGTLTPGAGAITTTGSTIVFNGAGAQSIPAMAYDNLTITGNRGAGTLSFAGGSGVIDIANVFDVSGLSNYTPGSLGSVTFNFSSASSQTYPAFIYGNITNWQVGSTTVNAGGTRVWANAGTIELRGGVFNPSTGTNTNAGSTVLYNTSGTLTMFAIPNPSLGTDYNNVEFRQGNFSQSAGFSLTTTGNFTLTTGTYNIINNTTANNLTVGGTFNLAGGTLNMANASGTGALACSLNVGVYNQTGGGLVMINGTFNTGQAVVNVTGTTTVSAGTITLENGTAGTGSALFIANGAASFTGGTLNFGGVTGAVTTGNEFRVLNGLSVGAGVTFTNTSTNTVPPAGVVFAGTNTQAFSYAGNNPARVPFTVNANAVVNQSTGLVITSSTPNPVYNVNGTLNLAATAVISGSGTCVVNGGATLRTAHTGGVAAAITTTTRTLNSGATYGFNGTAAQITSTAMPNPVVGLEINNSAGVTLSQATIIANNLALTSGILALGNNSLTLGNTATITGGGTTNYVGINGTGGMVHGGLTTGQTRSFPIGTNGWYTPLTVTQQATGPDNFTARVVTPISGSVADANQIVNVDYQLTSASNLADVTFGWVPAAQAAGFSTAATAEVGQRAGGATYPLVASGLTINTGTINTVATTGLTTFAAANPFAVGNTNAVIIPITTYTWNGSTDTDWATATNWTPNGVPGSIDNIILNVPGANVLSINSSRSITNFELSGTGTFTTTSAGVLTITGNITNGGTQSATLDPASTVNITSSAAQTIPAISYGNLNLTGGDRTFQSGATTGIAGTLTPGAGALTLTGSNIAFNGPGAQTINALSYNDLTISGNRGGAALTLAAGTIGVGGTFTATASNYTAAVSGNTFNFGSGSAQTVPAFFYNNITNTGNGARTLASSGVIDIAGTFTPGTGTYTVTGSSVRYSSTTAGTITLPGFSYNNLEVAPGTGVTYAQATVTTTNVAGNFVHSGAGTYIAQNGGAGSSQLLVTGTFTLNGGGTFISGAGASSGSGAFVTITGASTISSGTVFVVGATGTGGVTHRFNANGGLTISGTGRLVLEAATTGTTPVGVVNVSNMTVTSTATPAVDLTQAAVFTNSIGNAINLTGDLTKSGTGTFGITGAFTNLVGWNLTGTTQWNYTGTAPTHLGGFGVGATGTLTLLTDLNLGTAAAANNFVLSNGATFNPGAFAVVAGNSANLLNGSPPGGGTATINISSATGLASAFSGFTLTNMTFPQGMTFRYTGSNQSTGLSTFSSRLTNNYGLTFAGTGNLTLDLNSLTLTALTMETDGLLTLGSNNLTLNSSATVSAGAGSFSASRMVVADGTGLLIRSITSAGAGIPFTWPIGDNTGTAEYSPVTINNISTSLAGNIGWRVTDATHPNNSPATNFLSRYWTYSTNLSSYNWTNATFTYAAADINGTEGNFKLNAWDATNQGWTEFASSSAASNVLTVVSGPTSSTVATGNDFTARQTVPLYYRTAAAGPATWATAATWEVSSDPAFVSPAPAPAAVAPNAVNSAGITVQAGHTVNVGATVSVDQMTIEATGIVNANSPLNVADGTGTDLTIAGRLNNAAASVWATGAAVSVPTGGYIRSTVSPSSLATVTVAGTYEHAMDDGSIPAATWQTGSLCTVTGWINGTPGSSNSNRIGQNYWDFTWNCTAQTANVNLQGAFNGITVANDFTVLSTGNAGSGSLRFGSSAGTALVVGRDFTVNAGAGTTAIVQFANAGSTFTPGTPQTLTVNRDFVVSGAGAFTMAGTNANSSGATPTLTVGRNLVNTSTAGLSFSMSVSACPTNLNVTGNLQHGGTGTMRLTETSAAVTATVSGDVSLTSTGTLSFGAGTGNAVLNVAGNLSHPAGTTLLRAGSGSATLNFARTSGTQQWTGGGTVTGNIGINVGNGTTQNPTVALQSDVNLGAGTGTTTVFNGATLDMAAFVLSGSGTFVSNSGANLRLGHAAGIVTAPTASGNVQTTTRTFGAGSNYTFTGAVAQSTGNALPTPLTGTLNINPSAGVTVTLGTTNPTAATLNLQSGLFAIGSGNTLNFSNGGIVAGLGGGFATGATGGTIASPANPSTMAFNGTSNPYNVTANGGILFPGGANTVTIQNGGTFQINAGGFANASSPAYAAGSTLRYNSGGNYGRGFEWNASGTAGVTRGYPANVTIANNTSMLPGGNSNTGTVLDMSGSLNITGGSNMFLDFGGAVMTRDFNVLGDVTLAGGLSLSTSSGDLFVGGNWTRTGTLTHNSREVVFNGTTSQTFTGTTTFDFVRVRNTAGAGLGVTVASGNVIVNNRLAMERGVLVIGNNNVQLNGASFIQWPASDTNSFVVTNGTGVITTTVAGAAKFFPVGPTTTKFGSVNLVQNGTSETITVRAIDAPPFAGAMTDATQAVNIQYVLTESVAGANNLVTTFGWTRGSEAANFSRGAGVFLANWDGAAWQARPTLATSGTNPYFSVNTGAFNFTGTIGSGATFAVGNYTAFFPCFPSVAGGGDWNNTSTWQSASLPPASAAVCINGPVTITTADPNPVSTITLNTGSSLVMSAGRTLTIDGGGAFVNGSGAVANLGSGTVAFSGVATVSGGNATAFNNLRLGGNTTFSTSPTINNELQIAAGGFVFSGTINYGAASTLVYTSGNTYGRSLEWSTTNTPVNVRVANGTTLDINNGSNTSRAITGSFTVDAGGAATMGNMTGNVTIPGNMVLNGSFTQSTAVGGDLIIAGNWTSGASATLNANNRDVRFNGTVPQTITTNGPISFGFLTIDNTDAVSGVNLATPITVGTFRINPNRTFNVSADNITITPGGNVSIGSGAVFNANNLVMNYQNGGNFTNDGTFNRGTSTLNFQGTSPGQVTGLVQTNFHNILLAPGSGINFAFGGAPRGQLSGTFELRAGSFVTGSAPLYLAGSKLRYAGGGTFNRNVEWDASTLQKVEVANNTILKLGTNGTGFTHVMGDSLIIRAGSTVDMTFPNTTAPLRVGGTLELAGTLFLSNSAGGDLEIGGDFFRNNGTLTANDRLTTFIGSNNAVIKGNGTTFPFLTINKTGGASVTQQVATTLSRTGGTALRIQGGTFDLAGLNLDLGTGSNTLRIDAGFANRQMLRTGGTSIAGFSVYTNGTVSDSLGGRVEYSGPSAETALTLGYNQLAFSGNATKQLNTTTRVADSLLIAAGTTVDWGGALSIYARGHVRNNGTVTANNAARIVLNGGSGQTMSGNGTYGNLVINNSANVSLTGRPTVTNALDVQLGKLITGSADTIVLASAAQLLENIGAVNQHFVRGNLKMTQTLGTSASTFGGMGVQLTAGANLGTVSVVRSSGTPISGAAPCCTGNAGISRFWVIKPTVQPAQADRTLLLFWPSQDDNGRNPALAQVYKSTDGVATYERVWQVQNGNVGPYRRVAVPNVASFSYWTVSDNFQPLPLGLLTFTGRNEKGIARLSWTMTQEGDWTQFVVEKSADGRTFTAIGTVAARTPNGRTTSYSFDDLGFVQNSYYRLRLQDASGKQELSETAYISTDGKQLGQIRLFPNPAAEGTRIAINGLTDLALQITTEIVNLDGRVVETFSGSLTDVNEALQARVQALPAGMYHVKVSTPDEVQVLKLMKR